MHAHISPLIYHVIESISHGLLPTIKPHMWPPFKYQYASQ